MQLLPRACGVEDVRLIWEVVGDEVIIEASGGIRMRELAYELIRAGANRTGTSHSVKIVTGKAGEGGC